MAILMQETILFFYISFKISRKKLAWPIELSELKNSKWDINRTM